MDIFNICLNHRWQVRDLAADRSSEDATITASKIMWSMAATKVIEKKTQKEIHHSTSDGWRSATTWNEQETDKCWEEVTSILMGELVVGVPTTFVPENHGYVPVHHGINFPQVAAMQSRIGPDAFGWRILTQRSCHESNRRGTVETRRKRNSCRGMRWSLQGSEWKSNSLHVDMVRLWRLKLGSKATPTPVTKATGRRRDTDETLPQHDVRASREATGTNSSAVKSSIQLETWLYRHQANSDEVTKEIVLSIVGEPCCNARPSRIRQMHRKSESRHCQTLAGESIVVARASGIFWKHAGVCVRASAGGTARVDG